MLRTASAEAARRDELQQSSKDCFREAKAMLRRADDAPQPKQRKRAGETEGDFRKLARKLARRFDVRQQFGKWRRLAPFAWSARSYWRPRNGARPMRISPTRFDLLNQLNNDIAGDTVYDSSSDVSQNHVSPGF